MRRKLFQEPFSVLLQEVPDCWHPHARLPQTIAIHSSLAWHLRIDESRDATNGSEHDPAVEFWRRAHSLLLMPRWPLLTSEEHPTGKLQPYIGFGPSLVVGNSSKDLAPLMKTQDGTFTTLGADARAGLLWEGQRHRGVPGEYRFTYFRAGTFDERCLPPPQHVVQFPVTP
jgi:hypothetical protein